MAGDRWTWMVIVRYLQKFHHFLAQNIDARDFTEWFDFATKCSLLHDEYSAKEATLKPKIHYVMARWVK